MLERLVRKYEGHRDKKYENDFEIAEVKRHTHLSDRATVGAGGQRRVGDIRVSEAQSERLDNDEIDLASRHRLGDGGKWRRLRGRRWRTRRGLVRRFDGAERRKGKTRKGTVQWRYCYQCGQW